MRSMIYGVTVASEYPYIVYGSVRGLVSEHRSERAARRSLAHDQTGCESHGGYSDASVWEQTADGWATTLSEAD